MTTLISRTRHNLSIEVNGQDVELELTHRPTDEDSIVMEQSDEKIVVGYLVVDGDCQNPLEDCDGMGKIHSLGRNHSNRIDYEEAKGILESDVDAVALSYFEHGNCIWDVQGSLSDTPDFCWDGVDFAGVWVPDDSCREHIASSAIAGLLPKEVKVEYKSKRNADGTVDDKNLNIITLIIGGKDIGGFKSFESAYRSAARRLNVKLTKATLATGRAKIALECAIQACKSYTAYCNGDCWGVYVDTFDKTTGEQIADDACWGHVGSDWATQVLKEQIAYALKP